MRVLVLAGLVLVGCGGGSSSAPKIDAGAASADAQPAPVDGGGMPDQVHVPPDAAPGTPDARPRPDAAPGQPDARPQPDAAIPDAALPDAGPPCPPGQAMCGGGCIDILANPDNCGGCDHSCLGDACTDGLCPAVPLADYGFVDQLAVDDTGVYVLSNRYYLAKVSLDGLTETPIAQHDPLPAFAVGGGYVFWATYTDAITYPTAGKLWRAKAEDGLDAHIIWDGPDSALPLALAVHADRLYFIDAFGGGVIRHMAFDGSDFDYLYIGGFDDLIVAGDGLAYHDVGEARWHSFDGTQDHHLFTDGDSFMQMASDGTRVYYTLASLGTVSSVAFDGSQDTPLITDAVRPEGVAADGAHLYWTDSDGNGVYRASPDGTNTILLAAPTDCRPTHVVVDATHAYFSCGFGSIQKVAK